MPLPEQACIQLVTGSRPWETFAWDIFLYPCKVGYRFLLGNPELENCVAMLIGIKPMSPAFFGTHMLTTKAQHPSIKCIKFSSSNHPYQKVSVLNNTVKMIVFWNFVRYKYPCFFGSTVSLYCGSKCNIQYSTYSYH